jgi:hypothetical protein
MKLPWQTRTQTVAPEPESTPEAQPPRAEIYHSPGFEAVLSEFTQGNAIRVLDFGPAVPENIEFFSGFATRVQVIDAFRDGSDPAPAIRILNDLVSRHRGSFHLVLLWDALNYLAAAQAADVAAAVVPLCRPGARCMAMVATSDTMPASPRRYRVVDTSHLSYEGSTSEELGAPQMTPAAVERVLRGFSIEHAFVLRNGVREYVATRDAARTKPSG